MLTLRLPGLACLLTAAFLSACVTDAADPRQSQPGPARLPDLSGYRLGIDDRVRINVFGEGNLSLEATVDSSGLINYPLLGSVQALGKTAHALQETIREGLSDGYLVNPDVRVIVIQYRPIYVMGQVRKTGAYSYVAGLTVEKALAIAGGLTNVASTRRIYILREDQPTENRFRVDLDALIFPGDTLVVEEGLF